MRKKSTIRKIAAMLLVVIMVAMLFPAAITAQAEAPTVQPFYLVDWDRNIETNSYSNIYNMPYTWINTERFDASNTEINISVYVKGASSSNVKTAAQLVYNDFSQRPEGSRYINLAALGTVFKHCVKDAIDFEDGVRLISNWIERFLTEYKALGGELDGFVVDLEYNYYTSYYLQTQFCVKWTKDGELQEPRNLDILQDIVRNERVYQAKIRPQLKELEAQGLFQFYTAGINPETGLPDDLSTAKGPTKDNRVPIPVSEITTINRYTDNGGVASCGSTWGAVLNRHIADSINRAALEPMLKYYPDALLSDYSRTDSYSWHKGFTTDGSTTGTAAGVGNTSNGVYYGSTFSEYFYADYSGSSTRQLYNEKPTGQNAAVFETTDPFSRFIMDINNQKRIVASTLEKDPNGHTNVWVPYFSYASATASYGNSAYFSELMYHLGLTNPEPFLGYIVESEVKNKGKYYPDDPNMGSFAYALGISNELLAELTRVAGASDRKPIVTPIEWDNGFMVSGMYAGGRNIWRLTPDTTKVSVADFKVDGKKAPTFTVNGVTITFPQGRIIADTDITQIGSCGYWIETPADVTPVITKGANHFAQNPSFAEDFQTYITGTFTGSATSKDRSLFPEGYRPDTYWTLSGTAEITGTTNKVLSMKNTSTLTNTGVTSQITAGDTYAKQQAWEVTFTLPANGNYGTLTLLRARSANDGIQIKGGKAYYYNSSSANPIEISGVTLANGSTYTVKRTVDFTGSAPISNFYVYNASGTLLGSAINQTVRSITTPVASISITTSNTTNAVTFDNYKLYPIGVTTKLSLYEIVPLSQFPDQNGIGQSVTNISATRTTTTSYRVSWLNASADYKKAVLKNKETGAVIEEMLMAPGDSGYFTGTVEATADAPVTFVLEQVAATAPEVPDYEAGDFDWPSYAENMGICCYVGHQGYATLEAAAAAAKSGQTIVLMRDIELSATVVISTSVKIQYNGYTISLTEDFNGDSVFSIAAGGALNWTDSMHIDAGSKTALIVNGGSLNISGGTITGQNGVLITSGNLIMTGGTITATENAITLQQNINKSATTVTVTGGTITGAKAFLHTSVNATPSENLTVSISGATITGTVETIEPHFEMWHNDGVYTLHGHILVIDAAVNPTCTETGLTQGLHYGCCGNTVITPQTEVPALGHNWVDSTCSIAQVCSLCGISDGADALHPYTSTVTPPTCTAEGYTTYTCPNCGHSYIDNIVPATGHTPGAAQEENRVEAACTTNGSYDNVTYCVTCSAQVSRNSVVIPATGHTPGEIVVENVVDTTCTTDGSYDNAAYCTICQAEATRETIVTPAPEGGHNTDGYEKEVISVGSCTTNDTYIEIFYCTACGHEHSRNTVDSAAPGHKYVVGETHVTCKNCDYNEEIGTASVTITTGNNGGILQWKPTMSLGMAPLFAKTTADGALVLEGANANDYNLKVEWPVGGKPTLTMNGATLANNTNNLDDKHTVYHTIHFGGSANWGILLKGTNTINGAHNCGSTTTASHRMPTGIYAQNTGTLTINSVDREVDILVIDNYGGIGIYKAYNALNITSANVTIRMRNTGSNGQIAIAMGYVYQGYEDKTNLTVKGSYLTIQNPGKFSNIYIALGEIGGYSSDNAEDRLNSGDILFQNSVINLSRDNSDSFNSIGAEGIKFGPNATCTIDNCDFTILGNHRSFTYAPTVINCINVQSKTGWSDWGAYTVTPGTPLTANTNNSGLRGSHTCAAGEAVFEKHASECVDHGYNVTYCTTFFCGKEVDRELVELDPPKEHTICSKTLLKQTNAKYEGTGSFNSSKQEYQRIVEGVYTWQYTCSVCGDVWTEEENFKPAILNFISKDEGSANQNSYSNSNTTSGYTKTLRNPGYTVYYVTKANDNNYPNNRYMVAATADEIAAGTWNVKFEYPVGGNPVLTLKNATIINNTGLWYGFAGFRDLAPLTIVLEGTNAIKQTKDSQGVAPIILNTNNDVTINGTEGSSLYLESHSITGALTTVNGNLTMNDVNLTLVRTDSNPTSTREDPAIGSRGNGNVTINGGSINYAGFGRNGALANGSKYTRAGYVNLIRGNNITLNNANITAHGTFGNKAGNIYAKGDLVVNESTLFIAHGFAYTENNQTIYGDAFKCGGTATFNYANGVVGKYSTSSTYVDKHVDWTTPTYPSTFTDITTIDKLSSLVTSSEYVRYLEIAPVKGLVKFDGTAVTAEADLTLEFAIHIDKVSEGDIVYITRTRNGEVISSEQFALTAEHKEKAYYIIPYKHIAAKEIQDEITVVIKTSDGLTLTETKTDSVYNYALRLLRDSKYATDTEYNNALKTVLVNIINYGAMAQVQFNHNDKNLPNKTLTPSEWNITSTPFEKPAATPATVEKEATVETSRHRGTTFELKSSIAMMIAVSTEDIGKGSYADIYKNGQLVERAYATDYRSYAVYTYRGMVAADGRAEITFKIYNAAGQFQMSVTDSLAAYVGRMIDQHPYLENLMRYCDAAATYFDLTKEESNENI